MDVPEAVGVALDENADDAADLASMVNLAD